MADPKPCVRLAGGVFDLYECEGHGKYWDVWYTCDNCKRHEFVGTFSPTTVWLEFDFRDRVNVHTFADWVKEQEEENA